MSDGSIGVADLPRQLLRSGAGSVFLKASQGAFAFMSTALLARALGAAGYGTYVYVLSLVFLLAIPAHFGLPNLVMRETAKADVSGEWGVMRGLWIWTGTLVALFSASLISIGLLAGWLLADWFSDEELITFYLGLMLVPLIALGKLRGGALRGLRRVVAGLLPEMAIVPGVLTLLAAGMLASQSGQVPPSYAMTAHVAAASLAFGIGTIMLWRSRPKELSFRPKPVFFRRAWITATLPLACTAGMHFLNTYANLILLGLFEPSEAVGIYRVVIQVATLVPFGLAAINLALAPYLARLFAEGKLDDFQRVVSLCARSIFVVTLPIIAALLLAGETLLGYVFGSEYTEGYIALVILLVGQLTNIAVGPVDNILNMTGHERETAKAVGLSAVTNVVLCIILIPYFGMVGAAVAGSVSLTLWNVVLWRAVRVELAIESSALRRP